MVAYRSSRALEQLVIVPNRDVNPPSWMMVTHDGDIFTPIHFNAELLERARRVEFQIALGCPSFLYQPLWKVGLGNG